MYVRRCKSGQSLVCKKTLGCKKYLIDSLNEEKKEIDNLKQNPVPIGFIYVQLPSQPEPKTLWPIVEWKDVTLDYAGLFFRAEGGNSESFGKLQTGNAPFRHVDKFGITYDCALMHADYQFPTLAGLTTLASKQRAANLVLG